MIKIWNIFKYLFKFSHFLEDMFKDKLLNFTYSKGQYLSIKCFLIYKKKLFHCVEDKKVWGTCQWDSNLKAQKNHLESYKV